MVRTAVAVGRIAMAWHDDLSFQVLGACNCRVKVVDFKPEKHAISVGCDIWITDTNMVMLHIPFVQLKNQAATRFQSLILLAAMCAPTAEKTLIPTTARLNIAHANKGLWTHKNFVA